MRVLHVIVALALAVPLLAEQRSIELKAKKTGTGFFDYYNLGAAVGDDPLVYNLTIATYQKIDIGSVIVSTNEGEPLPVVSKGSKWIMFREVKWMTVTPTIKQYETAAVSGMRIKIASKRESLELDIPAAEFAAMIEEARPLDRHGHREEERQQVAVAQDAVQREQIARDAAAAAAARQAAAEDLEARRNAAEAEEERRRRGAVWEAFVLESAADLADHADDARVRLAPFQGKGTARVLGQAFLKTRGGEVRLGAGNTIRLLPADPWALRAADLQPIFPLASWADEARETFAALVRETEADASGNFEFSGLPAGEYRLETEITWKERLATGFEEIAGGRVARQFEVKVGESRRVMLTK
ncbi:MAG: carboxypeptidase-like regulatory domain-containing protein [Verrucomicrobiota bacterium]